MTDKMTWADARAAAKAFVRSVSERQWGLSAVEAHLPRGWILRDSATVEDFYPLTISNVAAAIRQHATR